MFWIQDENKDFRKILIEKDEKGHTSFFLAAQNNKREIVEVLQKNGINQKPDNNKDHQARTPLMVALEQGNDKVVLELCKHLMDEEITKKDIDDNNIFHFACLSDHPGKMMTILLNALTKNVADNVSTRQNMFSDLLCEGNINQETPLHILASKANFSKDEFTEILRFFRGLNFYSLMKMVNIRTETPIHISAKSGSIEFLETVLVIAEEKHNLKSLLKLEEEDGNSALHLSSKNVKFDVKRAILEFMGKDDATEAVTKENKFGWTQFSGNVSSRDLDSLKLMFKYINEKSFVNKPDFIDVCPLHLAAKKGHVDIFEYLIKNKADITKTGPKNKTALDIAIEKSSEELFSL